MLDLALDKMLCDPLFMAAGRIDGEPLGSSVGQKSAFNVESPRQGFAILAWGSLPPKGLKSRKLCATQQRKLKGTDESKHFHPHCDVHQHRTGYQSSQYNSQSADFQ
jgi:hypothetical protein